MITENMLQLQKPNQPVYYAFAIALCLLNNYLEAIVLLLQ
jgi:hypothetical protein